MFLTKIVIVSAIVFGAPLAAAGQSCGTFPDAAEHLLAHRGVFEDPEWAPQRAALGINAIDQSDPVEIVTDAGTCSSLIGKLVSELDLPGDPDAVSYAIYRYGDYYTIEFPPIGHVGDTYYHGFDRLRVYTVGQGQKLKGTIRAG